MQIKFLRGPTAARQRPTAELPTSGDRSYQARRHVAGIWNSPMSQLKEFAVSNRVFKIIAGEG